MVKCNAFMYNFYQERARYVLNQQAKKKKQRQLIEWRADCGGMEPLGAMSRADIVERAST